MRCYGKSFNKKSECKKCSLEKYCQKAMDIPLICNQMSQWDEVSKFVATANASHYVDNNANEKLYSRNDLLEVIGFMAALDINTLEILDAKLGNSAISFSKIARQRGVTRQAVYQFIKKKCSKIPELDRILKNNTRKQRNKNFMEVVCQIRRQTSRKKSIRQNRDSKSSRKLICWNPSLDLSKMSILKGSIIIRNVSKR